MPQIETIEYIQAPPQIVWDFISDLQRVPEWVAVTKQMLHVSTPEVSEGTVYRELTQVGSRLVETAWEVTTFRAPHVQVHKHHSATMDMVLTLTVTPEKNGTRFVHHTEYRLLPTFRPLGWLMERMFFHRRNVHDMRICIQAVKRIVEHEFEDMRRPTASTRLSTS
jgi:carbon monoxide dehydrogenase subunit G